MWWPNEAKLATEASEKGMISRKEPTASLRSLERVVRPERRAQ